MSPRQMVIFVVGLLILFWLWYCVAADYGYKAVSGTYTFDQGVERSTLVLHRDRLFQQETVKSGRVERIQGTWQRIGEGGVVFSKDFLPVTGQKAMPDGVVYGDVRKGFAGLFVSAIAFAPQEEGPVFNRRWFR